MKCLLPLLFIVPLIFCSSMKKFKKWGSHRIINGRKSEPNEFPWSAVVYVNPAFPGGKFGVCGSTIISKDYVITAYHCVQGRKLDLIVVKAGFNDLKNKNEPYRQNKLVAKIFTPPKDPKRRFQDICMVKVDQPFDFNGKVGLMPLPEDKNWIPPDNMMCTFTGIGLVQEFPPTPPQFLQVILIPIIGKAQCAKFQTVQEFEICSTKEKAGPCKGDSGGGLICKGPNQQPLLAGLLSGMMIGEPCGSLKYPNIFTRVSYFLDWIRQTLKM